jgi:glutamyl-tRNA reductase
MTTHIFAAEISYESAPFLIRERLPVGKEHIKACIGDLRRELDEVFVLSTANRFVIYGVGDSIDPMLNFFLQDPQLFQHVQFYRNTEAVVSHLFAMASGLCSPVAGEYQILTEIANAYRIGNECGSIGLFLDSLIWRAVGVAKKVHQETDIDRIASSVVETGFTLLYNLQDNLYRKNFLVVGSNEMTRRTLDHLRYEGFDRVTVASRDVRVARDLVERYGVNVVCTENIDHCVQHADIIIVVGHEDVSLFQEKFGGLSNPKYLKKYIILDLGVQTGLADIAKDHPAVEMYSLEDLKALQDPTEDPFEWIEEGLEVIRHQVGQFLPALYRLGQVPVLAAYWARLLDVKALELDWLMSEWEDSSTGASKWLRKYACRFAYGATRKSLADLRVLTGNTRVNHQAEVIRERYDIDLLCQDFSDN